MRSPVPWVAVAAVLAAADAARGDEVRERELEQRVERLEREIGEVRRQLGAAGGGSELELRVAQLEALTRQDASGVFGRFDDGFRFESADRAFELRIGGMVHADHVAWRGDGELEDRLGEELNTAAEFRRARVHLRGRIHREVEFAAEYDFAGGEAGFRDVWIGLRSRCLPRIRVGHVHVPFGRERQISANHTTFLERGLATTVAPGRENGLRVDQDLLDGRLAVAGGVFRDSDAHGDDVGSGGHGEWSWAARVEGRPWVSEDGESFLHLGFSWAWQEFREGEVRYRARPEVHAAPHFVDTGTILGDHGTLVGLDAAWAAGPFHLAAELGRSHVRADDAGDPRFVGWTVEAGTFLTGETRPFEEGNFGRVRPRHPFGEGGAGAFELAVRASDLDLSDQQVRGGGLRTYSVGLNWYLNPQARVMLDVVRARVDGVSDAVVAVAGRFQIDF